MANPEHLEILKQGVEAWNEWRRENPTVTPDLRAAHLEGAFLHTADFRSVNLGRANLSGARLEGAHLGGANLSGANLSRAFLHGADLRASYAERADLGAAVLSATNLGSANLSEARLHGAFLIEAILNGAYLVGADLVGADLRRANLLETNLGRANLSAAALVGANLTKAVTWGTTFGDNDLSKVNGLETVLHVGPSSIGIDTIFKSKGNIPEVFLRGCGVPEDFIAYMRSLARRSIESYKCFISYSSKDDDFVKRLRADLQGQTVHCYFAPEDLKIGDKFRICIDEAIRIHDKVLVILSQNSLKSPWVEKEVETAFEKERRQDNKPVLLPIRLDDAVMQTDQAWAADIRRTRHIGDFSHWKEHDAYQQAFRRLLRDLKAEQAPPSTKLEGAGG